MQCETWGCCLCAGWIARPRPQLWFTRSSGVTCGPVVSTSRLGLGLGSKTLWESGLACLTYQSCSWSVLQYLWVMAPVVAMGKTTDCGSPAHCHHPRTHVPAIWQHLLPQDTVDVSALLPARLSFLVLTSQSPDLDCAVLCWGVAAAGDVPRVCSWLFLCSEMFGVQDCLGYLRPLLGCDTGGGGTAAGLEMGVSALEGDVPALKLLNLQTQYWQEGSSSCC